MTSVKFFFGSGVGNVVIRTLQNSHDVNISAVHYVTVLFFRANPY